MKLKDIYKVAIDYAIKMDPRGEKIVKEELKRENEKYKKLPQKEKEYYDKDKLINPYSDSRIIYDTGEDVKGIMVGIDIEVGEVMLADRLRERGEKINTLIAHHPSAKPLAQLFEVMKMQSDIFHKFGVTISLAEDLTSSRSKEIEERFAPVNHYRAYDAVKYLNFSLMNMHTLADNCVTSYLQKKFNKLKPKRISDIIGILMEEPEYIEYKKRGVGPTILLGNKDKKVEKVFVDMTGGTEGNKDIYKKLSDSGVDTVVGMHFSSAHKKAIQDAKMNAIIAGHISSDTLGMNLLLDEIERKLGKIKIYEVSGFIRIKRKK